VSKLNPDLRRKVLSRSGHVGADEDSDEDVGDGSDDNDAWGKKKSYYEGDTADLEIGQDFDDAEDEEEAAKVSVIEDSHGNLLISSSS
jgi:hypothetical protein